MNPDFRIESHGSIVLVHPLNAAASAHLLDNVQDGAMWFAGALVVEPRYLEGLTIALQAEGFVL